MGMAHEDGTILASELYPVAEACGQTPDQIRSCLRRLVTEGLFSREGAGRDAVYRATSWASASSVPTSSAPGSPTCRTRPDGAGTGTGTWWPSPSPRPSGPARDALRDRLLALGGASVQGGLYVSPHRGRRTCGPTPSGSGIADAVTLASTDDLESAASATPASWPGTCGRSTSWRPALRALHPAVQGRARAAGGHAAGAASGWPRRASCPAPSPWPSATWTASTATRCCRPSCCPGRGRAARRATSPCGPPAGARAAPGPAARPVPPVRRGAGGNSLRLGDDPAGSHLAECVLGTDDQVIGTCARMPPYTNAAAACLSRRAAKRRPARPMRPMRLSARARATSASGVRPSRCLDAPVAQHDRHEDLVVVDRRSRRCRPWRWPWRGRRSRGCRCRASRRCAPGARWRAPSPTGRPRARP